MKKKLSLCLVAIALLFTGCTSDESGGGDVIKIYNHTFSTCSSYLDDGYDYTTLSIIYEGPETKTCADYGRENDYDTCFEYDIEADPTSNCVISVDYN